MRKFRFFIAALACLLTGLAHADTQTPYSYDFNTAVSTASPDFAPIGWGHLVSFMNTASGPLYMSYEWNASSGVDGTGCLAIGSQTVTDGMESPVELNDMLVTPAVGGAVSLEVKAMNYGSTISFWYVNYEDGKFTTDGQIDMAVPELAQDEFVRVDIPEMPEGTLIGIRGNSVYIDNFKADMAEVTPYPRMRVNGFRRLGGQYVDTKADGKFTLSYKVAVENTGQRDLTANEEGFSLSIVNRSKGNKVMSTTNIDRNLAMGATDSIVVTAEIPYADYPDAYLYGMRENLGGNITDLENLQASPYGPKISLLDQYAKQELKGIDFGIVHGYATALFTLRNDGATDLVISAVNAPADVTVTADVAGVVKPHEKVNLPLKYTVSAAGFKEGTLTVVGNGTQLEVPVTAIAVDSTEFYANFEDGKMPLGFVPGEGWTVTNFPQLAGMANNYYCAQGPETLARLTTPLLEVAEGEKLYFQAGRINTTSVVNVLYSTDRKEWHNLLTIKGTGTDNTTFSDRLLITTEPNSFAFSTYTVSGLPAGRCYVAFESGKARIDNIFGCHLAKVAHDIMFKQSNFPMMGSANAETGADVTFVNNNTATEKAGAYSVNLYVNGEKAATAAPADFKGGETRVFSLPFTPHFAGQATVYALFEADGKVVATSDTTTMTVLQESAFKDVTVGTPDSPVSQTSVPLYLYYKKSMSNVVYSADQLNLKAGTKISKLSYKGWNTSQDLPIKLKVYVANSDKSYFEAPLAEADTTAMTCIYNGDYTVTKKGSKTAPEEMLGILLQQPFVYTGGSLIVAMYSESEAYANVRFESDGNVSGHAFYRSDDSDYSQKSYSTADMPVVTLSAETDPTTFTGTVTAADGNAPIEGAEVTLTSGNVLYSATTNAEGAFSMNVYKTDRTYQFRVDKPGYEPFKTTVASFDQPFNVQLTAGHGIYIDDFEMPDQAMVNHLYTTRAQVVNVETSQLDSAAYTAQLVSDGKVLATTATPALKAGQKAEFTFSFTPYEAGKAKMSIQFQANGTTSATPDSTVEILPEPLGGSMQVLDSTAIGNYNVPIRTYDKNSESQTIYKAEDLNLSAGSVIHRIAFKGYNNNSKVYNLNLRVYIENTTDNYDNGFTECDTMLMTRIYADTLHIERAGTAENPVEFIVIDLPDGFRYTGDNLRLAFRTEAKTYARTYFVTDDNVKGTYYRSDDNPEKMATTNWTMESSPVMYLEATGSQQLTGTVTDHTGSPLQGVAVTMKHDNVRYAATTDADGRYSITVAQTALAYQTSFEMEGYKTVTREVRFGSGDGTLNVVLHKARIFSGKVIANNGTELKPLEGADVAIRYEDNTYPAVTDAEGGWTLEAIDAPQSLTLTVKAGSHFTSVERQIEAATADLLTDTLNIINSVSGKVMGVDDVTEEEQPLANATVVMAKGETTLTAETDANGGYRFDIELGAGSWTLTVTKSGYLSQTTTVVVLPDDTLTTVDEIKLSIDPMTGITETAIFQANSRADVYTLQGALVGRDIRLDSLPEGIYIVNGRKVAIKKK